MKRLIKFLVFTSAISFSVAANAESVTFHYRGVVTSVSGPGAAFGIVASVGDPVSGEVTYESTAVQTTATEDDPELGIYLFDAPSAISVTIGTNPPLVRTLRRIGIFDRVPGASVDDRDLIQINSEPINDFEIFQLGFAGPATIFETDGLQNVSDLGTTFGEYDFSGGFMQTENPNVPPVNQIIFDVTSITFVSGTDSETAVLPILQLLLDD